MCANVRHKSQNCFTKTYKKHSEGEMFWISKRVQANFTHNQNWKVKNEFGVLVMLLRLLFVSLFCVFLLASIFLCQSARLSGHAAFSPHSLALTLSCSLWLGHFVPFCSLFVLWFSSVELLSNCYVLRRQFGFIYRLCSLLVIITNTCPSMEYGHNSCEALQNALMNSLRTKISVIVC